MEQKSGTFRLTECHWVGDSYKCKAGICKADYHGDEYGKTAGNTWGNKEGKWSKILVKKGDTVWGIYSNEPTSTELEEFIKQNPYIAARGVVRDGDGNIKHLEIRAGEEISVPKDVASSHKAGYTSTVNKADHHPSSGNKGAGNKGSYGPFGKYGAWTADTCSANINQELDTELSKKINTELEILERSKEISPEEKDKVKKVLQDILNTKNIQYDPNRLKEDLIIRMIKKGSIEQVDETADKVSKAASNIKNGYVEDIKGKVINALGNTLGNNILKKIIPILNTYNFIIEYDKATKEFVKRQEAAEFFKNLEADTTYSSKPTNSDDSNDKNKQNIKQQPGSAAATGAPDPDDDFDFDRDEDDGLKQYEKFKKQDGSGRYECEKPESPVWKKTENFKDQFITNGLKGKEKEYYRWDKFHKDIEVYDNKGRYIGSLDPVTGKQYRTGDMQINKILKNILK